MHLATYLNDHLAGATAALELLEHLEGAHPDLAAFLRQLRRDIEEDRADLVALIDRVGAEPGTMRRAAAWVAEKFARLKLRVDDLADGRLRLLEALEVVAIGVHGKGSLWRALRVVPAARGPDYDRLIARADEQRERIETVRLDAARAAFAPVP
jgi:hypothetical protein